MDESKYPYVLEEFEYCGSKYRIVVNEYNDDDPDMGVYADVNLDVLRENNMEEEVWVDVDPFDNLCYKYVLEYILYKYVLSKKEE